jgi:hypothetical protein
MHLTVKTTFLGAEKAKSTILAGMERMQMVAWFSGNGGRWIMADPPAPTTRDFFLANRALKC